MSGAKLYGSIFGVLLLSIFTTGAEAQGTNGPVIGGELRGITQIRGKVLCVDCTLADVRGDQSGAHSIYLVTYPGGQFVFQMEWVSEPQRWTDVISSPKLQA